MKKILLVVLAVCVSAVGTAWAGGCDGCGASVTGYMAPNFRMIDKGEGNNSDVGFGMAFNRVVFQGKYEVGEIIKHVGFRVETDIRQTTSHGLQWAFIQPYFNEHVSLKFGRVKEPFSREILHPTSKLLTVDRHIGGNLVGLGYGGFSYGCELHATHEMFKVHAGIYEGQGAQAVVNNQDPMLEYGARFVLTPPVEGLEIGANVMMTALPGVKENGVWGLCRDDGTYADSDSTYQTNTGLAFGADVDYQQKFGTAFLWAQAEIGMGDNYMAPDISAGDEWEDYDFYSFMYFYLKGLLMVNEQFGIHLCFSQWDPNTDSDAGKDNETTMITPGVVYKWCKNLRTQAEVQLVKQKTSGDDLDYTHVVLQNVFTW